MRNLIAKFNRLTKELGLIELTFFKIMIIILIMRIAALMSALDIKDKIQVEFIHTPPYSPDFNLVEYIIHLLRLRFLHHLPLNVTIEQIRQKLSDYFSENQLQTPAQIQNIIHHIYDLVR